MDFGIANALLSGSYFVFLSCSFSISFFLRRWCVTESRHLISRMITVDPKKRATLEEVRNHVWVNDDYDAPPDNYLPERPPTDPGNINKDIFQRLMAFGYSKEEALRALSDPKQNPIKNTYYLLGEMLAREERKIKDDMDRKLRDEQEKKKALAKQDESAAAGGSGSGTVFSTSPSHGAGSGPSALSAPPTVNTSHHGVQTSSLSAPPSAIPNGNATSPSRPQAGQHATDKQQGNSLFSINEDHAAAADANEAADGVSSSAHGGGSQRGVHGGADGPNAVPNRLSPLGKSQFGSMPDTYVRDRRQSTPEYRATGTQLPARHAGESSSASISSSSSSGSNQGSATPQSATATSPPMQLPAPAVPSRLLESQTLSAKELGQAGNGSGSGHSKRAGGHVASLTVGAPVSASPRGGGAGGAGGAGAGGVAGPAAIAALKSEDLDGHKRRLSLPALDGSQPGSPTSSTSSGSQRRRQSSGGRNRHELRSVSGWFLNVSTTSSKLPAEILEELRKVLSANDIEYEHDGGYVVVCKDVAFKNPVEFEVEICKVPRLNLFGLHFKRINGSIWNYKKVCNKLLQEMSL
jgi:MAP/microtubule affinity-regulating kinase